MVALAPWAEAVQFRPLPGWERGAGGTFDSSYGPLGGVASRLPPDGILVFAVVYQAQSRGRRVALRLDHATRFPCCDGTYVPGGEYALAGTGHGAAYSVIVRVYFGSPPTRSARRQAQRALDRLELPAPRSKPVR